MPAEIIVVLEDTEAVEAMMNAIRAHGHSVQPFTEPMQALDALENAGRVKLLITCVSFPAGRGNGRSLALMAQLKRPAIKLLFLCRPEEEDHVRDLGHCLTLPLDVPKVAELAERLLT